jgi:hypothetical protein
MNQLCKKFGKKFGERDTPASSLARFQGMSAYLPASVLWPWLLAPLSPD